MTTLLDCAQCCTVFSASGFLFLIIIGSLFQKQPLYIKGPSNPVAAADGCYYGALIYLAFLLISAAYWILHSIYTKSAERAKARAEAEAKAQTSPRRKRKKGGNSKKDLGGNTYGALSDEDL